MAMYIFGSYGARYVKKGEGVSLFSNKKFTAILKSPRTISSGCALKLHRFSKTYAHAP